MSKLCTTVRCLAALPLYCLTAEQRSSLQAVSSLNQVSVDCNAVILIANSTINETFVSFNCLSYWNTILEYYFCHADIYRNKFQNVIMQNKEHKDYEDKGVVFTVVIIRFMAISVKDF